ncbi:MAG: CpaF family protein [Actinomycetia bacterium]|nr:CpaF family protein [Actinomycetes bacterium]
MYKTLIEKIDFKHLKKLNPEQRLEKIETEVKEIARKEKLIITEKKISSVAEEIYLDSFEFGPISPLIEDDEVTEIMINHHHEVYVEKNSCLVKTGICFRDNAHLRNIIDKILSPLGLRVDESSPMVDARLKNGSRINVVISPVSIEPVVVTIRKFRQNIMGIKDLVDLGMLDADIADFLKRHVRRKANIIISGGTSTGKTTLLNVLSNFISPAERVITIEDTLELKLNIPHVIRLESKPPNIEGRGAVTIRQLVKNSLRMRPDRIIVGEIRGPEAIDVLQAMNTGHNGSLSTLHANSSVDMLSRLETLLLINNLNLTPSSVKRIIASSLDLVVHLEKREKKKKVVTISRIFFSPERGNLNIEDVYSCEGINKLTECE